MQGSESATEVKPLLKPVQDPSKCPELVSIKELSFGW